MTDTTKPEQTEEQRQKLRRFLSGAFLVSINNAIEHGALPEDAALAAAAAGVNALVDVLPMEEVEARVAVMIETARQMKEGQTTGAH